MLEKLACDNSENPNNAYAVKYFEILPSLEEKLNFLRKAGLGRSKLGWEWITVCVKIARARD
jgi:hypothetical protein